MKQFQKSNPDDHRVKDWNNQISIGKKLDSKVASLHASIDEAIAAGNWDKADSQIHKLPPGDQAKSRLLRQVEEGRRQKQQVKALRAAVKADMKAKVWSDADRDIDRLLALVPGDPEATKWKKDVAKQRQ